MADTVDAFLPQSLQLHPFDWYRDMRESRPVLYDARTDCWKVFRYDDVLAVASDPVTFSSAAILRRSEMTRDKSDMRASLITMDPPDHRRYRSLVTQAFTPRAVAGLTPRITDLARDLIDAAIARGTLDVIDDLAYPLPVIVIAELLGVSSEDRPCFRRWSDILIAANPQILDASGTVDDDDRRTRRNAEVRRVTDEMRAYFRAVLAERRAHPRQDLISDLLAAEVEGHRLSEDELLSFCTLLLVAGNITTTNLLGNAMLCFEEHPGALVALHLQPELVQGAVEEVLRFRPPANMFVRVAASDTMLGGQVIRQEQLILAYIAAANHDDTRFHDPERFDSGRSPNPHLAFGHGIHFCVGAPLARLEARIALRTLLDRVPSVRRTLGSTLEPLDSVILSGLKHFPVNLEASLAQVPS